MDCIVQVMGVAPKPAVVQPLSAVSERGGQLRIQTVVTETKTDPADAVSQVSLCSPNSDLHLKLI